MRDPLWMQEEKRHAAEIIQIAIPVLWEAIAVTFAIGVAMLGIVIYATRVPA